MAINRDDVVARARELGFEDVGFTGVEPFTAQIEVLRERGESYSWLSARGIDLVAGTDPKNTHPEARSIIVLIEPYFREAYPAALERHFGRCYLDDDRVTKDRLGARINTFRKFLRDHGIDSKVPGNLPHRLAAARAGLGNFGKNCLFYSRSAVRQGSWVLPVTVTVDAEFEPDTPTPEVGCPDWCRNACLAACPTGALKGPRKIDPRRCISFLTYFGDGLTPMDLREPMGTWVYGCDHCQNICPRNQPWLQADLPPNRKVEAMVENFDLRRLLGMDREYFLAKIWPHMFYMSPEDLWRWKMNTARSMGNSRDRGYVPDLARAMAEEADERVAGMAAWALGRLGGPAAREALAAGGRREGVVGEEIRLALERA